MSTAQLTAPSIAAAAPSGLRRITDPRTDRVIAAIASLPFAYMLYYRLAYEGFDLPRIALAINFALLIVTMVVRRPPVRVTPKPLYWATAFVATYWGFMTLGLTERGVALAPTPVTHAIALMSLLIALAARLSLGRNIGFVPAQRELVMSYAYGIVRHPIYAGLFLSLTGFVLRAYTPRNLLIAAIGASLFVVKTFMEERFLAEDPAYVRDMSRVRWRWLPGIA
jgi:protein-S-isoprenylcysteine O-methyltransferase Ste14